MAESNTRRDEAYRDVARSVATDRISIPIDAEVELDIRTEPGSPVSRDGAWVAAWIWVDETEARATLEPPRTTPALWDA